MQSFYKSTSTTGTKALDCVGGSFTFSKNRPTANNGYTPYLLNTFVSFWRDFQIFNWRLLQIRIWCNPCALFLEMEQQTYSSSDLVSIFLFFYFFIIIIFFFFFFIYRDGHTVFHLSNCCNKIVPVLSEGRIFFVFYSSMLS